jgi:hypothetical protein
VEYDDPKETLYKKSNIKVLPPEQSIEEIINKQQEKLFSTMTNYVNNMGKNLLQQQQVELSKIRQESWEKETKVLVDRIADMELYISIHENILNQFSSKDGESKSFWKRLFGSKSTVNEEQYLEYQLKLAELKTKHHELLGQKKRKDEEKERMIKEQAQPNKLTFDPKLSNEGINIEEEVGLS